MTSKRSSASGKRAAPPPNLAPDPKLDPPNHDLWPETAPKGEHQAKTPSAEAPQKSTYIVADIPTASIDTSEQEIRDDLEDDAITELALDIQAHGLMQPIGVLDQGNRRFALQWGRRRLAAFRRLGRQFITAHIYDAGSQPTKAVALRENILRRPMTLSEECNAVCHLHHEQQLSPDSIASLLSKSRAWVLRRLAVQSLPDDLREPLLEGNLSIGAAETLARLADPGARRFALEQTMQSALGITQVRAMVETLEAAPNTEEAVQAGLAVARQTAQPTQVTVACAACGTFRLPQDLVTLRVCAQGCPVTHHNGEGETHDGSTTDDGTPHPG